MIDVAEVSSPTEEAVGNQQHRQTMLDKYQSIFEGMPGHLHEMNRLTAQAIDVGIADDSSLEPSLGRGFLQVLTKDTIHNKSYPHVGLKIHVALDADDPEYAITLESISQLCCSSESDSTEATSFKVMLYKDKEDREENPQSRKTITVYPKYLQGEQTNTTEAIRLIRELRTTLKGNSAVADWDGIFNEHKSGPGIFIRAGAFDDVGEEYEKAGRADSFSDQLNQNLSSPETDGVKFVSEVEKAIEEGLL